MVSRQARRESTVRRHAREATRAVLLSTALACAPALLPIVSGSVALGQAKPLSPDDQAAVALNAGRRAYNDRNYPAAIGAFREFVQKFPNQADARPRTTGWGCAAGRAA